VDKDPDQALVARHRGGDPEAFRELVVRYQRPIYNAAFRVLGNAADAADITQDVFLRISQHIDEYDQEHKFFSWVYRIALNQAINLARRNWREEPLDDGDALEGDGTADPERSAQRAELTVGVQGALLKLRVDDRAVLALRHFSELSYREISEVLSIDEKTVKSRLFEARLRMRELLREYH
jgi:RNA polymerase sigma-70 factor (ECF subfamily)